MGFRPVHVSLRSRIQSAHGRVQRLVRALADATPEPRPGDIYALHPRGEVHLVKLVVLRAADMDGGWWVMAADEDPLPRNDDIDFALTPDAESQTEPMTLRGDRVLCLAPHLLASERRIGRLSRAELARALALRADASPEVTDTDLAATLASVDRQLGLCAPR